MPSGAQFPIPPLQWPQVGRQWPTWNIESDQAEGLVLWMPWGGGTVPGGHSYVDQITGRTFTKTGTPVWVADSERGWSMEFVRASTEYLYVASVPVSTYPISMACWFRPVDTASNANTTLMALGNGNASYKYRALSISEFNNADVVRAPEREVSSTRTATATAKYTHGVWGHACALFISQTSRAALFNGANKGTNADDPGSLTAPSHCSIGARYAGLDVTAASDARIRDARIYNRILTDTQAWKLVDKETRHELFEIPRHVWRLGVAPTGVTVAMDTLGLTGTAQTMAQVSGAVSLAMDTLNLAGAAQALTQISGAVSLAMDALGLTGSAQALAISVGAVSLAMDALGLTGSAQALTVSPGAVSLAMDVLDLAGAAQGLAVAPGAVTLAMDTLGLTGSTQSLTVSAGIFIAMALLDLTGNAQGLAVAPGEVTIAMSELQAAVAVLALAVLVVGGKLDVALTDAAVTLLALSDAAATALAMSDAAVTTLTLEDETRD